MKFPFELRKTADVDVVGFGSNAVDHLIEVDEFPQFNSKVEFAGYTREAGGEVATTLVGLERLGARTAYAGRFGDDREGKFGLESLVNEGVDASYVEVIANASTQTAFIIIDRRSGERTILWHRDPKLAYFPDEAPIHVADKGKVLHMTAHDTEACVRMAVRARQTGVIVSLDVDRDLDGIEHLLPLVDVLIGSSEFPRAATGLSDPVDALRAMQERYGCAIVGATLGKAGSIISCNGEPIRTGSFKVPGGCKDTTGAGDAFRTGFLYGIMTGQDVEDSARLANAVAAIKCRRLGARSGLPVRDELELFIK